MKPWTRRYLDWIRREVKFEPSDSIVAASAAPDGVLKITFGGRGGSSRTIYVAIDDTLAILKSRSYSHEHPERVRR
ncbi:MAG: hypothetical protein ACOCZB_08120 [Spirochaetota bacterium]